MVGAKRAKLSEIDALRGAAACGVALFGHFGYHLAGLRQQGPGDELAPMRWLYDCWLFVDLFFVISGFIFAHVYPAKVEWKAFAIARFARLYPLHLVTFAAVAAMAPIIALYPTSAREAGLHLLFLQGFSRPSSFNAPSWSLSVEAACYALFVLAMIRPRLFVPLCALLVAVGVSSTNGQGWVDWRLARGLLGFFAGCLLYRIRPHPAALICAGVLGVALLQNRLAVAAIGHAGIASLFVWPALVGMASHLTWLNNVPLRWLGDRSYSIYLIHLPVHLAMRLANGGDPLPLSWGSWGLAAVLVLLAADLSYRYLEVPARNALRPQSVPSNRTPISA